MGSGEKSAIEATREMIGGMSRDEIIEELSRIATIPYRDCRTPRVSDKLKALELLARISGHLDGPADSGATNNTLIINNLDPETQSRVFARLNSLLEGRPTAR